MNFLKNCLDFITGKDRQRDGEGSDSGEEGDKRNRGKTRGQRGYEGPKQKVQRYNHQPLLKDAGQAGVQGLDWFYDSLTKDEDGDVADECILCEGSPEKTEEKFVEAEEDFEQADD